METKELGLIRNLLCNNCKQLIQKQSLTQSEFRKLQDCRCLQKKKQQYFESQRQKKLNRQTKRSYEDEFDG